MSRYDFLGKPGDNGVILGGMYTNGKRVMMCMADHAQKGIWMTDPLWDDAYPCTRAEEIAMGDDCPDWYGSRQDFDRQGWVLVDPINPTRFPSGSVQPPHPTPA